ncbi:MAG: hypothetical protein CL827_01080 [Crocinitomicaceae bacterium]|nr:hypothetical protein [Crocinitomicaceae bacterium]|tara:strand:+ start:5548 stop:6486 length:939 start_codon:yes stop_codon:yes gene_type:complete
MLDYSIIIPVYCNEGTLLKGYEIIKKKVLDKNPNLTGEVIYCDDGSSDNSFEELKNLKRAYHKENIKIIKFSRNFGQAAGVYAGLKNGKSKSYIIMSADLQDPIELINDFLSFHFNDGFQIVIGEREGREDPLASKIIAKIAYRLINKINFNNYPLGGIDYLLISQKVKSLMLNMNDSNPFWQGEILWTGFPVKFIPYHRKKRMVGKSKWTISKKITYFIDGVFGFSFFPIRILTLIGFIISFFGIMYAFYILIAKILGLGTFVFGWAPIMIVILLLSGFQITMMGILGEYVWRTLAQAKKRPLYIVETIID